MEGKRTVAVLGATGSIGTQALQVLTAHADRFRLVAFSYHSSDERASRILKTHHPDLVVKTGPGPSPPFPGVRVLRGREGLEEAARMAEIVLVATAGNIGVFPTLAALRAGNRVALANKETLVSFGPVVKKVWRETEGELIPVDSEHSALFQLLEGRLDETEAVYLTASGGPFRTTPLEELRKVRPEEALKHPTWRMGRKITVDSATLMNKGLEIIEAHWLFDLPPDRIHVVIHPQSIVHGLVLLKDGSLLAHLGAPDMRIPIQYALTYPERLPSPARKIEPRELGSLTFEPPDFARFPAPQLAYLALEIGGTAPAVLNAANEEAVHAFLRGQIGFLEITALVERALEAHTPQPADDLETLMEADRWARKWVHAQLP